VKIAKLLAALLAVCVCAAQAQAPAQRQGQRMASITGKVVTASADSLEIAPIGGRQSVTVQLSADTRFERVEPASFQDVKVGDTVRVTGQRRPAQNQAAAASRIQIGDAGPATTGAAGGQGARGGFGAPATVKSLDPFTVTVEGSGDRTYTIGPDTEVVRVSQISAADVKPGDWVSVTGTREGQTVSTRIVRVGPGVVNSLSGAIASASKGAFALRVGNSDETQVKLTDGAVLLRQNVSSATDLGAGELVAIRTQATGAGGGGQSDIEASAIYVGEVPESGASWLGTARGGAGGRMIIGSVSKTNPLTVRTRQGQNQTRRQVRLAPNATVVRLTPAYSFDLAPGERVSVFGRMSADGTFLARAVMVGRIVSGNAPDTAEPRDAVEAIRKAIAAKDLDSALNGFDDKALVIVNVSGQTFNLDGKDAIRGAFSQYADDVSKLYSAEPEVTVTTDGQSAIVRTVSVTGDGTRLVAESLLRRIDGTWKVVRSVQTIE